MVGGVTAMGGVDAVFLAMLASMGFILLVSWIRIEMHK
jgi:hypothetical protein